jgi:Flp pilus assembly protein TadG
VCERGKREIGGTGSAWLRLKRDEATQLVELAVTLPLLVVMVVGIFDFGGAYNLKQNLSNAARAGARFGSSLSTADLASGSMPNSVVSIRNVVDSYLTAGKINDCGLAAAAGGWNTGSLTGTYTASGSGCPGTLTLTIARNCSYQATVSGASRTINVISTCVTISYPHAWQFGRVIGLLAPGANYARGVSQITGSSVVPNLD